MGISFYQSRTEAFERALPCTFFEGPSLKFNKQIYFKAMAGAQEYEPEGPHCHGNMAHWLIQPCILVLFVCFNI